MPITISGSTGIAGVDGSAATPAVQGTTATTGVYYPAANQVAIATNGTQRVLVDASGNMTVTGTLQANGVTGSVYPLVSGTAQNSTSGTSIDFTGIPSWVKRVTVMFNGVSTNGASSLLIQIGAGSVTTSGYVSTGNGYNQTNATVGASSTAGFLIFFNNAANTVYGAMVLTLITGTTWVSSHSVMGNSTTTGNGGGGIALSGALDRVRITTVNGTDTFDAGSINILYE